MVIQFQNKMQSELFSLAKSDFAKGLVVAVLTLPIGYIYQVLSGGGLVIDPHKVLHLALVGFFTYIAKNFLSDTQGKFLGVVG